MIRRLLLPALIALTAFTAQCIAAEAPRAWPQRPVRIVVAAPAGSSLDMIARLMVDGADGLRAKWGQAVIVDNKPAAGGTSAATEVARAAADGYTLYLGFNGPLAIAPSLYAKLAYDPLNAFAPIVLTGTQPNLLVVNASLPVANLKEFIALARSRPGTLNYASVGNGSASHLCMELLKRLAGVDIVHIPFNGGPPATHAVVAGDVQALFAAPSNLLSQVRAGKLKALAVTSRTRFAPAADIPTVAESGIAALAKFEAIAWNGLLAPAGTPRDVVARINQDVNEALANQARRTKLFAAGIETGGGSPEAFEQLIAAEARKWGEVVRATGAKVD